MELWASGFNAWDQLCFEGQQHELPNDLEVFKCILQSKDIELLRTTLVSTLVRSEGQPTLILAGRPTSVTRMHIADPERFSNIAMAGNDRVIEIKDGVVTESSNFSQHIQNNSTSRVCIGGLSQIAAGQTFFTGLSPTGEVYTWGDARFESTLGREVSPEHPAQTPCRVQDLSDLPTGPIHKISSGGYVSAALTIGNDLYLWGGRVGQPPLLPDLSSEPTPFDLEGEDVLDVAVGNDHIIALSSSHRVFVVGSNSNGQLGLESCKQLGKWKEVDLPLGEGQLVVSVYAGYKNSFVLVKRS